MPIVIMYFVLLIVTLMARKVKFSQNFVENSVVRTRILVGVGVKYEINCPTSVEVGTKKFGGFVYHDTRTKK